MSDSQQSPSVAVLLSAYNGEEHLRAQLDSLAAQTLRPDVIFVRDDSSTDGTAALLRAFAARPGSPRVEFCDIAPGRNLGWRESFRALVERAPAADFYAFCDQDDAWAPEKLARQTQALIDAAAGDMARPLLCTCGFDYADAELRPVARHKPPVAKPTLRDTLFYTHAIGFSTVFNAALRDKMLAAGIPPQTPHDRWAQGVAAVFGGLVVEPAPLARYRRHGGTATVSSSACLPRIRAWMRQEIFGDAFSDFTALTAELLARFGDEASPDDRALLERFAGPPRTAAARLRRALYPRRFRPSLGGELALRLGLLCEKGRPRA